MIQNKKNHCTRLLMFLITLSLFSLVSAQDESVYEEDIKKPFLIWCLGPLFSLGLNIFRQGTKLINTYPLYIHGTKGTTECILFNSFFYGITDQWSVEVSLPALLKQEKLPGKKTVGLANFILQTEYAFYQRNENNTRAQCTILVNATMPTTTAPTKSDILSTKAPSYFVGLTTSNATHDWYTYGDIGVYFTTKRHRFKLGTQVWYDIGFGRTFYHDKKSDFALLLEMSGYYTRPNKVDGKQDLTTGGNRLYLGPTLRYLYENFLLMAGYQQVISNVHRDKPKPTYRIGVSLTYHI